MATITFKAKIGDHGSYGKVIRIPELKREHCDMAAFRSHPTYGGLANSDLFRSILRRIRREVFGETDYLRLDSVPAGVAVDPTSFLAVVTVTV